MRCEKCGTELEPGSRFCSKCGAPVPSGQAGSAKKCASCGTPLEEGARFCDKCGSPVQKSADEASSAGKCANCGAPLEKGVRFCEECGSPVPDGAAQNGGQAAKSTASQDIPASGPKSRTSGEYTEDRSSKVVLAKEQERGVPSRENASSEPTNARVELTKTQTEPAETPTTEPEKTQTESEKAQTAVPPGHAAAEAPRGATSANASGGVAGFCEACGAPMEPGTKFCEKCGAPVGGVKTNDIQTQKSGANAGFCESCGAPLAPGTKFCETCGAKVGAPASGTPSSAFDMRGTQSVPPAAPAQDSGSAGQMGTEKAARRMNAMVISGIVLLILGAICIFTAYYSGNTLADASKISALAESKGVDVIRMLSIGQLSGPAGLVLAVNGLILLLWGFAKNREAGNAAQGGSMKKRNWTARVIALELVCAAGLFIGPYMLYSYYQHLPEGLWALAARDQEELPVLAANGGDLEAPVALWIGNVSEGSEAAAYILQNGIAAVDNLTWSPVSGLSTQWFWLMYKDKLVGTFCVHDKTLRFEYSEAPGGKDAAYEAISIEDWDGLSSEMEGRGGSGATFYTLVQSVDGASGAGDGAADSGEAEAESPAASAADS